MIIAKEETLFAPILRRLPDFLCTMMLKVPVAKLVELEEITLASGAPVTLRCGGRLLFLAPDGSTTLQPQKANFLDAATVRSIFTKLCDHCVYSLEQELSQGYFTIEGGHRVGVCGTPILEDGRVVHIKDLSALNIRVSRQILGCGQAVLPLLLDGGRLCHTLIVSPPGCGKTTLLRDLARLISSGAAGGAKKVAIADERGEIAAMYQGTPQNDVGCHSVVMNSCPKALAMTMLLRSMGPDVVITDEIGTKEDLDAVNALVRSGVTVLASAHGRTPQEAQPLCAGFEKLVLLGRSNGVGTVEKVVNLR